jgi:hypothetical protein
MLATLLIWLSVAVAVLALVDLFLSTAQKDWLSNVVLKLWSILDEAKGWSFADWLKEPRSTWWLAGSFGLLYCIYQVWLDMRHQQTPEEWPYLLVLVIPGFIFAMVMRPIFARLLKFTSGKALFRKLATIALLTLIANAVLIPILALTGVEWIFIPGLLLLGIPSFFVLLCLLTILVARVLAYLFSAILYVGEFLVRRIAEYPKGPVLAISVFFGGMIALIKAFG